MVSQIDPESDLGKKLQARADAAMEAARYVPAFAEEPLKSLEAQYVAGEQLASEELRFLRTSMGMQQFQDLQKARGVSHPGVVPISAGRTEAQIAAELRDDLVPVLGKLVDLINKARAEHGMTVQFQIGQPDAFNRQSLVLLEISKKLC